ncbi:hypothetical protein EsH8_X_000164 [Colletotrichum jinshuiense]
MSKPTYILVRIIPSNPVTPAAFRAALQNITITAYDKSVRPGADRTLGTASGLIGLPDLTQNPAVLPPLVVRNNPWRFDNSIIQHLRSSFLTPLSVATAIIVVDNAQIGNTLEYPTPTSFDVSLKLTQQGGGSPTAIVAESSIDFNIQAVTEDLSTAQFTYIQAPTDIYLTVQVPSIALPNGTSVITLSRDGRPPNFDVLRVAINNVLDKDRTIGAPSIEGMTKFLTAAQSQQIASELIYNRIIDPPPKAPLPTSSLATPIGIPIFEDLYTDGGSGVSDEVDRMRQKFDGERTSYHALRDSDSLQLANYVFSLVTAVQAELFTVREGKRAVLEVPIKPTASHTSSTATPKITLSGRIDPPGTDPVSLDPAFIVPAPFFYALTTSYALNQDFKSRIQVLLTIPAEALQGFMTQAIDAGVLGPVDANGIVVATTTLTTSGAVPINHFQAIRRIAALQPFVPASPDTLVQPARNADVQSFVVAWLSYPGTDESMLVDFWTPQFATKQYLSVILEIIAPNQELLISTIMADLRTPSNTSVTSIDDIVKVTEDGWLVFFQAHQTPDILPSKYLLGDLAARVHSFVMDIAKILFIAASAQQGETHTASDIPFLDWGFDRDVLVQFFASFSSFSLSGPFGDSERQAAYDAALGIFSGDKNVADFVADAVRELWTLYQLTNLGANVDSKLRFSYMEALHARGLTTAAKILDIPADSFPDALIGTVAFRSAGDIYTLAENLPWDGNSDDGPIPGVPFRPVNAGNLVNCMPPCHLSPLGPVQYLYDLLALSDNEATLRDVIVARRGDIGQLLVTSANLDLPLPVIDIVNENLEAFGMGLEQEAYEGPIYNTLDEGLVELDVSGADTLRTAKPLTQVDLLRALPQHSTPHYPLPSPIIYDRLKSEIGRPSLPYSQSLDVNRTYLKALGTSRFESMRTFQKDITELPQDAAREPDGFEKAIWRLPVRHDIAIEYLCISLEEATKIFSGKMSSSQALQLLGIRNREMVFIQASTGASGLLQVSQFMEATGISYCEFLDLHASGIVKFKPDTYPPADEFPECLTCCAETVRINIGSKEVALGGLIKLAIFVRLWRRLKGRCGRDQEVVSMKVLADICVVLQLFTESNVNKDFLVQLSALLMLKETWNLTWTEPGGTSSLFASEPGDERTELLALWSGTGNNTRRYRWAIQALLNGVERHSIATFHCSKRPASWRKIIAANLDDLASLAGFDGTTFAWNSKPTCTIRFIEVLSKIYASNLTTGEIMFMFTTRNHVRGDDPYPFTEEDESLDDPLNVPEDDTKFGLWSLRRKLLQIQNCDEGDGDIDDDEASKWTWSRIEATLHEMGYTPSSHDNDALRYFATHFFPEMMEAHGHAAHVRPHDRRFTTPLPRSQTSPQMWQQQAGNCSPFHFDEYASHDDDMNDNNKDKDQERGVLWIQLPLRNEDVLGALRDLRQLNRAEATAVRILYQLPRATLAPFGLIFSNVDRAADYMTQEPSERMRFRFFQREFAVFVRRCRIIAHHLNDAVSATVSNIDSGSECHCWKTGSTCAGMKVAWTILLRLIADENRAHSPWENPDDSGPRPQQFDFDPGLTGGAFAALLGLTGTGLLGRYRGDNTGFRWTETRGGMSGWGAANNFWNSPLVTLIPSLSMVLDENQSRFASFKNGFGLNQSSGNILSGAEPFIATWVGVLLIECDGNYHFAMRCPMHGGDEGACHCEKLKRWSVSVQRGQKTWALLNQGMDDEDDNSSNNSNGKIVPNRYSKPVSLRRGVYDINIVFRQPEPDFDDTDDLRRFHTGFVLKYTGPDTDDCLIEVPMKSLYIKLKNGPFTSGVDHESIMAPHQPQIGIRGRYISTLRDIRRTYQRAFKAILFAQRFCLSACRSSCEWESELGYLLSHPEKFQGLSYYLDDKNRFNTHRADLDFNLLPVNDAYFPPDGDADQRAAPSWKRQAALFDWFERIFDYTQLRKWVRGVCEPPVWQLFYHANADSPQPVTHLVRYFGIDIALSNQVLEYFEAGGDLWKISDTENLSVLTDERWTTRVWMAGRYFDRLRKCFYATIAELTYTRPALWVSSPDGNLGVDGTSGNANLTRFVQRSGLAESDAPPRLSLVVELNNHLRTRARNALLAYLDYKGYTKSELTNRLLLDVEAGIDETITRVDDAIAAVQRFMQRLVLGLEGNTFQPSQKALEQWACELSSFDKWQAAQRRRYYFENWIHWEEVNKQSQSESLQSLKKFLKGDVSTVSAPVRSQFWQQPQLPAAPGKHGIPATQSFALAVHDSSRALDEGLHILGTPNDSARPTWLAKASSLAAIKNPDNTLRSGQNNNGQHHDTVHASNHVDSPDIKDIARIVLPGAESLSAIPIWIQAAVRLGTRFIRVAASGVSTGIPYQPSSSSPSYCCDCSRSHPRGMDEYYFWLEDARRFDPADAPAPQNADLHANMPSSTNPPLDSLGPQIDPRTRDADPTSDWDSPTPKMLAWKAQPQVFLRWTRVHQGQLLDPRRSTEGIPLTENEVGDVYLDLAGRHFDSLFLNVVNGGGRGFRYDIATDAATVIPEAVTSTDPPALPLPAVLSTSLAAFPYFLYLPPGAPLAPIGTFGTSLVVATSLRADCQYEEATNWLRLAYDPLGRDNTWMQCRLREQALALSDVGDEEEKHTGFSDSDLNLFSLSFRLIGAREAAADGPVRDSEGHSQLDLPCCPSSPVKAGKARGRAAVLEYLETLLEWADALCARNSLETSQRASTLLRVIESVLGPAPIQVNASDNTDGRMTVASFHPYAAPLNPRLVELYAGVADRMSSLRATLNKGRLSNGAVGLDAAQFGSHQRFDVIPTRHNVTDEIGACGALCCFSCCHPYRFSFVLPKAQSWAALAKATAGSMLSAMEKADAEALSSLRLSQERQMTELGLDVAKNAYRAADWDVQVLDRQMAHALTRLQHYQKLLQSGLNTGENAHVFTTGASTASRTSATVVDGVGQGMASVPDMWMGMAGVYGTPLQFQQMPMGVKLGTGFAAAARILNTVADISATGAGLSLTQAGWDRREDEWQHTADITTIEITQIKRQRLAARRRLDTALRELNNAQRRIEHAAEVQDFARDKTSRYALYLYLQQENAALYRQCYEVALRSAREAQQALRFELGDDTLNTFIPSEAESWDSLHSGLLAGEKLELALYAMERAHMNRHCREYELQKHVSLRLHFPAAFVLLKATGSCEVDLPEWLFDLDYPGHFMRRIRSVSLTVPCVAGPYTGVHCKLQQLSSTIRFRPARETRDKCGCCSPKMNNNKAKDGGQWRSPCPSDPNVWRRYAGTEAIATSAGQNDAGLFELSFSDPRYLPFEYTGAVSRWRIELPPDNNQFDFDSLSDVVMHINFTAREGGPEFAKESNILAQAHVPGDGWRFLDIRHEMPEVWNVLRDDRFPFLNGRRGIVVTSLHLLLDTKETCNLATTSIHFVPPHRPGEAGCVDTEDIPLVRVEGGMLKGTLVLKQPIVLDNAKFDARGRRGTVEDAVGTFTLPFAIGKLVQVLLLGAATSAHNDE